MRVSSVSIRLQARASGMDAVSARGQLRRQGCVPRGVDTQDLLVHGTPEAIASEIQRLKKVFGPRWIVSPSHEALLPDVPPANVGAMAEAAPPHIRRVTDPDR